jgi:hypothetical protein
MFALLKRFEILEGGQIDDIETLEMEMDSAMALHNLSERFRQGLMDGIPDRAPCPPDAHIITRDNEPNMKIGNPITQENTKFPSHWKKVMSDMTSVLPDIDKILNADENLSIFSQRVLKRGSNLYLGGNVAQISSKAMENDVFRFQARVYASMKAVCYTTFADLQKGEGVLCSVCDCKNG